MSSDNFWYVKGNRVYMGDASDYQYFSDIAMAQWLQKYKEKLARKHPYHLAETHEAAQTWAMNEYSEYGTYWIDEE